MSSILVCCTPAHGHVAPTLTVARHLSQLGHDVRVLTSTRYADAVRRAGLEHVALPSAADIDLDAPNKAFPERAELRGVAELRFSLINLFVRPAEAQVRAIDAAIAERPADVVLAEVMFFGAAAFALRPRSERPAVISLGIVPLSIADPDVAPYGLGLPPLAGPIGRLRNAALGTVSRRIFAPIDAAVAEVFERAIGSAPKGVGAFETPLLADRLLQLTVPGFEYPRGSLPDSVSFVGPLRPPVPDGLALPEWWDELDGNRPVVHVSQGTIANRDFAELVLPTIRALAKEDVLVVVSTGGQPLGVAPGDLPSNVRVAAYLPYDLLFPKLAAFVTNGGYGGLHTALRHGVPIVAGGATEDKVETTARVAWSGAGINLRTERPSPAKLRRAVRKVLSDSRYAAASSRLATEIEQAPGLAAVAAAVDELCESPARR